MPKKLTEPSVSEAQIQQACTQMLELDGWRSLRTSPVSNRARGVGFGEPGMADCLYIRYEPETQIPPQHRKPCDYSYAQIMWIEWKRLTKSGKPTKAAYHQNAWHALERKRGALTLIAGEDFPASIEGFKNWYVQSGLMRNRIL